MDVTDEQISAAYARNPLPKVPRLFHYSNRTDIETLIRQIGAQIFYFSNPSGFNDAIDFSPYVVRSHDSEAVNVRIFTARDEGGYGQTSLQEAEQLDHTFAANYIEFIKIVTAKDAKCCRAFCLTERDSMPLMWAHYGGRSRGVAYGFDVETLAKIRVPHKILYVNSVSLTEAKAPTFPWEAPLEWRCKEKIWGCEREWRLFTQNRGGGEAENYVSLHGSLRSITFGLNCDANDELVDRVRTVINQLSPAIELFQVDHRHGVWTTKKLN